MLLNFVIIKKLVLNTHYDIIPEKHFHFDEELFNTCPDNVNIWILSIRKIF